MQVIFEQLDLISHREGHGPEVNGKVRRCCGGAELVSFTRNVDMVRPCELTICDQVSIWRENGAGKVEAFLCGQRGKNAEEKRERTVSMYASLPPLADSSSAWSILEHHRMLCLPWDVRGGSP